MHWIQFISWVAELKQNWPSPCLQSVISYVSILSLIWHPATSTRSVSVSLLFLQHICRLQWCCLLAGYRLCYVKPWSCREIAASITTLNWTATWTQCLCWWTMYAAGKDTLSLSHYFFWFLFLSLSIQLLSYSFRNLCLQFTLLPFVLIRNLCSTAYSIFVTVFLSMPIHIYFSCRCSTDGPCEMCSLYLQETISLLHSANPDRALQWGLVL